MVGTLLKSLQVGRPDEKRIELFDKLCNHIDNDECQYSLNEAFNNEELYFSENWLQEKLVSYYGEDIIVVNNPGRPNIICFNSFANKVLRTQWKEDFLDPALLTKQERIIDIRTTL